MNEQGLKALENLGAELGAAKSENERLRGLLRELREITSEYAWDADLEARVDATLSQQAEPSDAFTAVDMATAEAQGFRDGQAAVEPSAAQAEQKPVSWQFYQDGKWWNGGDRIKDHRKNTEAAGIPVRDLYAAPIAQTAPQPEQSQAATDVLTERRRQVEAEGWTPEHDDAYGACELSRAAACYASWAQHSPIWMGQAPEGWPWGRAWWKPGAPRRNLIKAGALILAEIERLDRAALSAQGQSNGDS